MSARHSLWQPASFRESGLGSSWACLKIGDPSKPVLFLWLPFKENTAIQKRDPQLVSGRRWEDKLFSLHSEGSFSPAVDGPRPNHPCPGDAGRFGATSTSAVLRQRHGLGPGSQQGHLEDPQRYRQGHGGLCLDPGVPDRSQDALATRWLPVGQNLQLALGFLLRPSSSVPS